MCVGDTAASHRKGDRQTMYVINASPHSPIAVMFSGDHAITMIVSLAELGFYSWSVEYIP
jgi:hypothetical protein